LHKRHPRLGAYFSENVQKKTGLIGLMNDSLIMINQQSHATSVAAMMLGILSARKTPNGR